MPALGIELNSHFKNGLLYSGIKTVRL